MEIMKLIKDISRITLCEDEELRKLFNNISISHIILSVSKEGKPINTTKLDFN